MTAENLRSQADNLPAENETTKRLIVRLAEIQDSGAATEAQLVAAMVGAILSLENRIVAIEQSRR